MTIPHQGIGRGRLVPSSHKGSKFRYTFVGQFSRGDERIREDIPVPDSLGKETFLVGIRRDNRLILLYKGLKGKARIPTDDLIPKARRGRNQHSLAFQIPSASKDSYKYSFFPQTIRDWNPLFLPLNCQMIVYLSSPLL